MTETFSKKIVSGGKITIPKDVRDKLDVDEGDRVKVKIQRDEW